MDFKIFDHYIFPDAPFFERIKIYSTELCERNLKLITKNNLSNFEIFDLEIISDEKEQKVVKTQEYWNLNFIIEETGEEYKVNELNTQIYFLKKIENNWKIWDYSTKNKKSRILFIYDHTSFAFLEPFLAKY